VKLYFSRHGESEANRLRIISNRDLPHPLTEAGRLQAEALAERLRGKPLTRIYASPILRARQTGESLSAALTVPLELTDGLREPDCGVLEGRGDPQAWSEHKSWLDAWLDGQKRDQGPQGGETYNTVRGRFIRFVMDLAGKFGESPAEFILVTHGAVMLFGLPGMVEGLDARYLLEHGLDHAGLLVVEYKGGILTYRE